MGAQHAASPHSQEALHQQLKNTSAIQNQQQALQMIHDFHSFGQQVRAVLALFGLKCSFSLYFDACTSVEYMLLSIRTGASSLGLLACIHHAG